MSSFRRDPEKLIAHTSAELMAANACFSPAGRGYCVNGTHFTEQKEVYEHGLIIGATGSGKSTRIIVPSLTRLQGSLVVHDPSRELLEITRSDLESRGYEIIVLNFSEPGAGYNPLMHCKQQSDDQLLCELLVRGDRSTTPADEHWLSRGSELLEHILHLTRRKNGEEASLGRMRALLLEAAADQQSIEKQFAEHADETHKMAFLAMTSQRTNEVASIFSTALASMKLFADPVVTNVTARNDIDFAALRHQRTAIYLQTNASRSHLYSKIISIFFEQLFQAAMETVPAPNQEDITFVIDEAASLYLKTLPHKIDKARKYRVGFLLAIQSLEQLRTAYGDSHATILDNIRLQVFLGGQKGETANMLEEMVGKEGSGRPRLPKEKIRALPHSTAIVLSAGRPPVVTTTTPYYENIQLKHLWSSKRTYKADEINWLGRADKSEPWDFINDDVPTNSI